MIRRTFAATAGAWLASAAPARGTGGLDIGQETHVRDLHVLLAAGSSVGAAERTDAASFRWNGGVYRGSFSVVTLADGRPGLVNTVPLDAYLYGVIGKEMSPSWPRMALEAQAIAARTYVLLKMRADRSYDVVASEIDQRYGGLAAESVEGRAAVDATSGRIVVYGGAPATAVAFSSCCGGRTAEASGRWVRDLPYLRSVTDPYCVNSPEYRWRAEIPFAAVKEAVGAQFASLADLQRIDLIEGGSDGRPSEVVLRSRTDVLSLKPANLRNLLGTTVVRSTFLRGMQVVREADERSPIRAIIVDGNGRGHGVGMCQWGARGIATAGGTAEQILRFYFPAADLGRA